MNAKNFFAVLKRRNVSESRDHEAGWRNKTKAARSAGIELSTPAGFPVAGATCRSFL
jgi:hypothetical protein